MILARIPLLSDIFSICGKYSLALAVLHIFVVRFILAMFYTMPTDTVFPPLSTLQILTLGIFDVAFIIAVCTIIEKRKTVRKDRAETA